MNTPFPNLLLPGCEPGTTIVLNQITGYQQVPAEKLSFLSEKI